jgi:hypothetical protein
MAYVFETADCDRIVGRLIGEGSGWLAVSCDMSQPSNGYALAVHGSGTAYAVFTVYPGPDRSILTADTRYFAAQDYRHTDRGGIGHLGAFAAAQAYYDWARTSGAPEPYDHGRRDCPRECMTPWQREEANP